MAVRKIVVVGSIESLPRKRGEIWKVVPGFDGYAASNQGRVASLDRKVRCLDRWGRIGWRSYRGQLLSPGNRGKNGDDTGYPHVQIGKGNYNYSGEDVHKLVMLAFVGPPPSPDHEIRHVDGNPQNMHLNNLRYGTYQDNYEDRVRHGRDNRGEKHYKAKLTAKDVRDIRASVETTACLARHYGVSKTTIHDIRYYRRWAWLYGDT